MQQQQQQYNPLMGQHGQTVQKMLSQFNICGGTSEPYKEAMAALPRGAQDDLLRAIHEDTKRRQQQMMQKQM